MIISYIIFLLLTLTKNRTYEPIEKIYTNLVQNIHELSFNFIINGTNDYSYFFKSKDILFFFDTIYLSEPKKEIIFYNQHIKILFNLEIYENISNIFDLSSKAIKHSEMITVDLGFKYLKFYQEFKDFSWGFDYNIENIKDNILVHFENIININIFKYLLFEEKKDIYENKTLIDFIKLNIINAFKESVLKSLIYYPECDEINYFNLLIKYFKNQIFLIDLKIYGIGYDFFIVNKCKINEFNLGEIIKENKKIIFKNIQITMYLEIYETDPNDYEKEIETEEIKSFVIDYITIDQKFNIQYGKSSIDENYVLDSLKIIVNKTIDIIERTISK